MNALTDLLNQKTVADLKQILRDGGQTVTGKKADLIARIEQHSLVSLDELTAGVETALSEAHDAQEEVAEAVVAAAEAKEEVSELIDAVKSKDASAIMEEAEDVVDEVKEAIEEAAEALEAVTDVAETLENVAEEVTSLFSRIGAKGKVLVVAAIIILAVAGIAAA
jgi:methyl-accepting chemotaxis protein